MIITNARFASPDEQTINATIDGKDYTGIHPGVWLWSVVMESGVTVAPYEPPPAPAVVFPELTQRQFWLAALELGVTEEAVDAMIEQMPEAERAVAKIEKRHATGYQIDHPLVAAFSAAFGIARPNLEAAWMQASTL